MTSGEPLQFPVWVWVLFAASLLIVVVIAYGIQALGGLRGPPDYETGSFALKVRVILYKVLIEYALT